MPEPRRPYARPKNGQEQALTRRYREPEEAGRRAALGRKTSASVAAAWDKNRRQEAKQRRTTVAVDRVRVSARVEQLDNALALTKNTRQVK